MYGGIDENLTACVMEHAEIDTKEAAKKNDFVMLGKNFVRRFTGS